MKRVLLTITILLQLSLLGVEAQKELVNIGVLAHRGEDAAYRQWGETAVYLQQSIPEYRFKLVPLGFEEIHRAIRSGEVEFVLANSAFYVELEMLYGVSRIATLINRRLDKKVTEFGAVIFTKSDRTDIRRIEDIKNRSFVAVDANSFGGWMMGARLLHQKGLKPNRDFSLSFAGTHDGVVYAIRDGKADAGTVRSDTLERMANEGKISINDFYVIEAKTSSDFPFLHTTELYPEWPMAKNANTSQELARKVASALLAMPEESKAALASESAG